MVADDCYIRDSQDKELCTVLVSRLSSAKALFAVVCGQKGVDDYVVIRLAQLIHNSG